MRDKNPDEFAFENVVEAEPAKPQKTDPITVSGIDSAAPISIVGGEYSIDGGAFTDKPGVVSAGQKVVVQAVSPEYGEIKKLELSIGGVSTEWSVASREKDDVPDPFSFSEQFNVPAHTWIESETITLTGFDESSIEIANGEFKIDNGFYTRGPATIRDGSTLTLRHQSPDALGQVSDTHVTVGSVEKIFRSTTQSLNRIPSWVKQEQLPVLRHISIDSVGANAVVSGDLNGDGDADLLVASEGGKLVWFATDGGKLPRFTEHTITSGEGKVSSMLVADMDGDGDADILVAGESLIWYQNGGSDKPIFTPRTIAANPVSFAQLADFDRDGDLDVLAAGNTLDWYENSGDPAPTFTQKQISATASNIVELKAGDLDGDGDADFLVASASDKSLSWYENSGSSEPNFTSRKLSTIGAGVLSLVTEDIDGDGDLDILWATSRSNKVLSLVNNGQNPPLFTENLYLETKSAITDVQVEDMEGDGDKDLIIFSSQRVAWFENSGNAETAFRQHIIKSSSQGLTAMTAVDLNGDGPLEMVLISERESTVTWYDLVDRHYWAIIGSTLPIIESATDEEGGDLTYELNPTLSNNIDTRFFNLDGETGSISFASGQARELPNDQNRDYRYEVWLSVSDGLSTLNRRLIVTAYEDDNDDDNDGVDDSIDLYPLNPNESADTDGDGTADNADTDDDNDGVPDRNDDLPLNPNESVDTDGDGIGNNEDQDDDNDGVSDQDDTFPLDPKESIDSDKDGTGNNADTDDDNDGVEDDRDAFPLDPSENLDTDNDGIGNNADTDDDNDGVEDSNDAFPLDPTETVDADNDGIGNNADTDDDNDGVEDSSDAFPLDPTESVDTDNDGIGNNTDTDDDNDGVEDGDDAFPLDPNESVDTDNDGIGNNTDTDDDNDGVEDSSDAFPLDPNESVDTDNDGIGNNADTDDDNDGVEDGSDAFPLDPNESADTDNDGIGNNADTDDDNDGVEDKNDAFPLDPNESVDTDNDGIGNNTDTDDDNDGVSDQDDAFPLDPNETIDTDKDGIGNNADNNDDNDGADDSDDAFPLDPNETTDTDGDGVGNNADTDDDNDGIDDNDDAFPLDPNESVDTDKDGIGNNADTDDDNDGVEDDSDAFPLDPSESVDTDNDGIGNNADTDDDNDGVADSEDAFPLDPSMSVDTDEDGVGNSKDNDDDNDGVPDADDAFPLDPNESLDTDGDGIGNNADTDDDNDGVEDKDDAFPLDPRESVDTDNDGIGNNADTDDDNDGVEDKDDAFPLDPSESVDTDKDGIGNNADPDDDNDGVEDKNDAFPLDPNESVDTDNDGIGNNADTDDDNDGAEDENDAFPLDPNETLDTDKDGVGNNADTDDDGDGVADKDDAFPLDPSESVDTDKDGIGNNADTDDDNDGVEDSKDAFPLDPDETTDTDNDGIGNNADTDDDGDGVADKDDAFPLDPNESVDTDNDGIGNNADTDDDGDGVEDSKDAFPLDPHETTDTDNDGIGNNADTDDDGDGVADKDDAFPLDPNESADTDGDGVGNNADIDDDGDGVEDTKDAFPLDPNETLDTDQDGIGNNADTDDDNDGVEDASDAFPLDKNETLDTDNDGVGNNADTDDDGDGAPDTSDNAPLDSKSQTAPAWKSSGDSSAYQVEYGEVLLISEVATDDDGNSLTYSINTVLSPAEDAAFFNVNATPGEFGFRGAPGVDVPGDENSDNVYEVTVSVTDGYSTLNRKILVTVVDSAPNALVFASKSDVLFNAVVVSETLTLKGFDQTVDVSVSNGEFSIDGGAFTSTTTQVRAGATLQLRHTAPATTNTTTTTEVTVGKTQASFSSNTQATNSAPVWNLVESSGEIGEIGPSGGRLATLLKGDFDGDGDIDILAGHYSEGKVYWYENDGKAEPNFIENFLSDVNSPWALAVGDIDSDGYLDLFAGDLSGSPGGMIWFKNDAGTGFAKSSIRDSGKYSVIKVGDIDSDGNQDIVASVDDKVVWYQNDGSETFTEVNVTTNSVSNALELADLDQDGDLDLVVGNKDGVIKWFENSGSGVFTERDVVNAPVTTISVGDMDADGDLDILAAGTLDTVYWIENDAMSFTKRDLDPQQTISIQHVLPEDVDGDGDRDVIYNISGSDVLIWAQSNGAGDPQFNLTPLALGASPLGLAIEDLNGDFEPEVITSGEGKISWYRLRDGYYTAASGATLVLAESATDADGNVLSYAINTDLSAAEDLQFFSINPSSGELTFSSAPAESAPTDANKDNVYEVWISVSDGLESVDRFIRVKVYDDDQDDDNDGIPDTEDRFPLNANADSDGDGINDQQDTDDDNDGVKDGSDAFPLDPKESVDTDNDGIGNNADTDDDGDGEPDTTDNAPLDSSSQTAPTWKSSGDSSAYQLEYGEELVVDESATDEDGNTLSYSINTSLSPVKDAGFFSVDTAGELTFKGMPGVDTPGDEDTDNVYEVTISVTDGHSTLDRKVLVTVVDTTPDALVFAAKTDVLVNSLLVSETLELTGFDQTVDISVSSGEFSISGGAFTSTATQVSAGVTIQLRHTAAATINTTTTTEVTVGKTKASFVSTTQATNTAPEWNLVEVSETIDSWDVDLKPLLKEMDVDGDGDIDIFTSQYGTGEVSWYENGGGATPVFTKHSLGSLSSPAALGHGDIDSDGDIDLFVVSDAEAGQIVWYENDGAQDPSFISRPLSGDKGKYTALEVVDLDADGDQDMVVILDKNLSWYENTGGHTFARKDFPTTGTSDAFELADLDQDGDIDIVISDAALKWFENVGGSAFTEHPVADLKAQNGIVIADTDTDGDLDILIPSSTSDGQVSLLENENMAFAQTNLDHTASSVRGLLTGDVDGDGDRDILFNLFSENALAWMQSDGEVDPQFKAVTVGVGENPSGLAFADLNGDQLAEVLVLNESALNWYRLKDGYYMTPAGKQIELAENAVDADGNALSYSINNTLSPAADAALFQINENTGTLTFASAPVEAFPADDNQDNVYEVWISVSDSLETVDRLIRVKVYDDDNDDDNDGVPDAEDPFPLDANHDSDGDGIYDNVDSDDDNDGVKDGSDAFPLDPKESVDTDGDGIGNNADTDDDNDGAPDVSDNAPLDSNSRTSPAWKASGDSSAHQVEYGEELVMDESATDEDGNTLSYSINTSLSPVKDAGFFSLNTTTGELTFKDAPGVDAPGDENTDNVYEVTISVTDGYSTLDRKVLVTVVDTTPDALVFAAQTNVLSKAEVVSETLELTGFDQTVDIKVVNGEFSLDGGAFTSVATQVSAGAKLQLRHTAASTLNTTTTTEVTVGKTQASFASTTQATNSAPVWNLKAATGLIDTFAAISNGRAYSNVRLADMDGDGDNDVISAYFGGGVYWFENDGKVEPGFTKHSLSSSGYSVVEVGDLDSDGDLDILATSANPNTNIVWYESDGSETPTFTQHYVVEKVSGAYDRLAIGDIDGDGDIDVAAIHNGIPKWYKNNGNQSFSEIAVSSTVFKSFKLTDLDQDGDLDLVCGGKSGVGLEWYENNGSGSFTSHLLSSVSYSDVDVTDADGDGDLDILATFGASRFDWFENDGMAFVSTRIHSGVLYSRILSGDVDGDSDKDILASDVSKNSLLWLQNDGGAYPQFTDKTFGVGAMPYYMALGDLNGDFEPEVITVNNGGGDLSWYRLQDGFYTAASGSVLVLKEFATDADVNPLNYSINTSLSDAKDAAFFSIDASSGELTFNNAPAESAPADANSDNIYEVWISVSDGWESVDRFIRVKVYDDDEDDDNDGIPDTKDRFPLNANGDSDGDGINDQQDTDDDNDGVKDGSDAFPLDPKESVDTDGDGIGNNADTDDDNDGTPDTLDNAPLDSSSQTAPVWVSGGDSRAYEVEFGQELVMDESATDEDGNTLNYSINTSLSPVKDTAFFTLNTSTGALTFKDAPGFDTPGDEDGDNVYEVTISVTDGHSTLNRTVSVTVIDTTPDALAFTSKTDAPISTWVESETLELSGFSQAVDISVANGEFSINGGAYTSTATQVNAGNTIQLRHTAAAAMNTTTTTEVTVGKTKASFVSTTQTTNSTPEWNLVESSGEIGETGSVGSLATLLKGDFDGDGDIDILAGHYSEGKVYWYENDGNAVPNFSPNLLDDTITFPWALEAGDIDSDGDVDLFVGGLVSTMTWYKNDAEAGFTKSVIKASGSYQSIKMGDIDGDGDADLIANVDYNVVWYQNDGNETFTEVNITSGSTTSGLALADLDQDGDLDFVVEISGFVKWFQNNGSGDFTENDVVEGSAYSISVSDMDGDGDLDILAASRDKGPVYWIENDAMVFSKVDLDPRNNTVTHAILMEDVDGDGDRDVLHNITESHVVLWAQNNGEADPQFNVTSLATGDFPVGIAFGDLNGDLEPEVITGGGGKITWYRLRDAYYLAASGTQVAFEESATDVDLNTLSYSINTSLSSADATYFSIDSATGVVTFNNAPAESSPGDVNGDNIYEVWISVSDSMASADRFIRVKVYDDDSDDDNDGVPDSEDPFPFNPKHDTDGDGIYDNMDNDDDNDGIQDGVDVDPLNPTKDAPVFATMDNLVLVQGRTAWKPFTSSGGQVSKCSADAMPPGLRVEVAPDHSTCGVTGIPSQDQPAAIYTVTALNAAGSISTPVSIEIVLAAPRLLVTTHTFSQGDVVSFTTTNRGGGKLTECSGEPPAGYSLAVAEDKSTCVITGTAKNLLDAVSFDVTAVNVSGSSTAAVTMTVNAAPPNLQKSEWVFVQEKVISLVVPNSGGEDITECRGTPPDGYTLAIADDKSSCVVTGIAVGLLSAVSFDVTAVNALGESTAQVTMTVNEASPFVTAWRTTASGEQVTITTSSTYSYNYNVDWGDGNSNTSVTGDISHTYATAGEYKISITGLFPQPFFRDENRLLRVESWGNRPWSSMDSAFYNCNNLKITDTNAPDLSQVNSTAHMFEYIETFNSDISGWDVSNVKDMNFMFKDAHAFNQDISGWDVSNVTDMSNMFRDTEAFDQPIGSWNVSKVVNTQGMFRGAKVFNQDINAWDVSQVEDMSFMFDGALLFNQDISRWNVEKVTTMRRMFRSVRSTEMTAFDQNIGSWKILGMPILVDMFKNTKLSTANYDALLIGWSSLPGPFESREFNAGLSVYSGAAVAARDLLTNTYGWVIKDGGLDFDADGVLDSVDTDDDNDGVLDVDDAFPHDANESVDTDGDGIGNNADTDDDGDGTLDTVDNAPLNKESASMPVWTHQVVEPTKHNIRSFSSVVGSTIKSVVANLDNDDKPDILTIVESTGSVLWHESSATSPTTFTEVVVDDGGLSFARYLAAGDMDNDGDQDIVAGTNMVAGNTDDTLVWYEFESGAFTKHIISSAYGSGENVVIAKVDSDEYPDIVVSGKDSTALYWFKNDGAADPSFTRQSFPVTSAPNYVAATDMDSDGDMDILALLSGGVYLFENGGGSNPEFISHSLIEDESRSAVSLDVSDINGDGYLDVLLSCWNSSGEVAWYENAGTPVPSFSSSTILDDSIMFPFGVSAQDLDGDGDIDGIDFSTLDGSLIWYENDGSSNPLFARHKLSATTSLWRYSLGDLDGDNDLDILLTADNTVAWQEFHHRQYQVAVGGTLKMDESATDADNNALTYSINTGLSPALDAAYFSIDSGTGELTFTNAPALGNPGDQNGDNVYEVWISVTDGYSTLNRAVAVSVQ